MISYRKRHVKNKIHRARLKKSIFKRRWFWIMISLLSLLFIIFYFLFFYSGFYVENILILGNEKVKIQSLQDIVSKNINTRIINFGILKLDTRSIFWINRNKLNREILERFPAIEKIKTSKNFPKTLVLEIVERRPIGAYCSDLNNEDQQCFLIDKNGIIFESLSIVPSEFTVIKQISENNQMFTGEEVIAQSIMNAIFLIKKNLKDNFRIELEDALITSPLRLNVKTNELFT